MKIAYFDCFSGISGNMIIGALIDAGLDPAILEAELKKLPVAGYSLSVKKVLKNGISGTHFSVITDEHHSHRSLSHITGIINDSGLDPWVKEQALAVFTDIGTVEARIHGVPVDEIHFHEIGAVDSIVDITGAMIALKELDIAVVESSAVHLGSGFIKTQHGLLPVPAPATAELLKSIPVFSKNIEGELTTPTGAALIVHLARRFGPIPAMKIHRTGYGAGTHDLPIPNLLRVHIGETQESDIDTDDILVMECNIDDMNPQYYQHIFQTLLDRGALDVFITPIIMKKGRPASLLTVLCTQENAETLQDILFRESTTSGIRIHASSRKILKRSFVKIETKYGIVSVKVHEKDGEVITIAPEYEDCRRIAEEKNVPLKEVCREALQEAPKYIF